MKKYIVVGLLLISPSFAHAETNPGVEFLTPLVQQIIHLLQDRIAELSAEIALLKSTQPTCILTGTNTPVVPVTPPVITNPTPNIIITTMPTDTIAPDVSLFTIETIGKRADPPADVGEPEGKYLRIFTNEILDISKTTISAGSLGKVVYDGKQDGTFKKTGKPGYYYEVAVSGASGSVIVVIEDMAGNKFTREIVVR